MWGNPSLDGYVRWNCPTDEDSLCAASEAPLEMIQLSAVTMRNVGHAELSDP